MKFIDLVQIQKDIRSGIVIARDNKCISCGHYERKNLTHGTCSLFEAHTCHDASCGKYHYYKENRKL